MKKPVLIVCVVLMVAVLGLVGMTVFLKSEQSALLPKPPLHGTLFVVETDLGNFQDGPNALINLAEAMRKRFAKLGFRVYWEPISDGQIRIITPIKNTNDAETAKAFISRAGRLEFRLVHEESDKLVESGEVPSDCEVLKQVKTGVNDRQQIETLIVKKKPELLGSAIQNASVMRGNLGEPQIAFRLNPDGTAVFANITRQNVGRRLAIVLDGELYSAPVIQSAIESGCGIITGRFDLREAFNLAALLECPLPTPVRIVESKTF